MLARKRFTKSSSKLVSFLRSKRFWPKEKRTPKNPVKVLFICHGGGTSNSIKGLFLQELAKRKISSITANNLAIADPMKMTEPLWEADFIVHHLDPSSVLFRGLHENASPKSVMLNTNDYYTFGTDFLKLINLIKSRFWLKK